MDLVAIIVSAIATILSALISAGVTLFVCIKNNNAQQTKFLAEMKTQSGLTQYRLEQLEAKVSVHNHFDARLISLEERVKTIFNKLAG